MSTREEILAALTEAPDGLTSKELAPRCPAADFDQMIVGRTVAMLSHDNVIHRGTELRKGDVIWIFGKKPEGEKREPPITLPTVQRTPSAGISDHAMAIARMRGGEPQRSIAKFPVKPVEATVQKDTLSGTIAQQVEYLLRKYGPMDSRTMRKRGIKSASLGPSIQRLIERRVVHKLGGGPKSTIFGFPGQKLGDKGTSGPVDAPVAPPKPTPPAAPRATVPHHVPKVGNQALAYLKARRTHLTVELEQVEVAIADLEPKA